MNDQNNSSLTKPEVPKNDAPAGPGWFKRLLRVPVVLMSTSRYLLNVLGLVTVGFWSLLQLAGWYPPGLSVGDLCFVAWVIGLLIFEITKTNFNHEINKTAFVKDLVTGVAEIVLFAVVFTILVKDGLLRWEWFFGYFSMFVFVVAESTIVIVNRFSMGNRSVNVHSDTDQHHGSIATGGVSTGEY